MWSSNELISFLNDVYWKILKTTKIPNDGYQNTINLATRLVLYQRSPIMWFFGPWYVEYDHYSIMQCWQSVQHVPLITVFIFRNFNQILWCYRAPRLRFGWTLLYCLKLLLNQHFDLKISYLHVLKRENKSLSFGTISNQPCAVENISWLSSHKIWEQMTSRYNTTTLNRFHHDCTIIWSKSIYA